MITVFLQCAQKWAVSVSSDLGNLYREEGRDRETPSLARLIPGTAAPGPPEGEFGVFKRLIFSSPVLLSIRWGL